MLDIFMDVLEQFVNAILGAVSEFLQSLGLNITIDPVDLN